MSDNYSDASGDGSDWDPYAPDSRDDDSLTSYMTDPSSTARRDQATPQIDGGNALGYDSNEDDGFGHTNNVNLEGEEVGRSRNGGVSGAPPRKKLEDLAGALTKVLDKKMSTEMMRRDQVRNAWVRRRRSERPPLGGGGWGGPAPGGFSRRQTGRFLGSASNWDTRFPLA